MTTAAILFDKDGTLFDMDASWGRWSCAVLSDLAGGDAALAARLGARVGVDLGTACIVPDSLAASGTPGDLARALAPLLPACDAGALAEDLSRRAESVRMVATVPLGPVLDDLRSRGLVLGLATNDTEAAARAHLERAGIADQFTFLAGADSGHGAKPGPGMCIAFAEAVGVAPGLVAMVGDSHTDMAAARAAGCLPVLVGKAPPDPGLLALAEAWLPDVAALPPWLDGAVQDRQET